jgi:hypothetical protein
VRIAGFFPQAGVVAFLMAALPPVAPAQSGNFTIALNGHAVGTASFHTAAAKDGLDKDGQESSSLVRLSMTGLNYALSKTERLSPANQLEHAHLSATVNGEAVTVEAAPAAAQLVLKISAGGKNTVTPLPAYEAAVLLPDFDPGALETLLALAAQRNNRDLWAILPKNAGSVAPVEIATYADQQGTLDGKPIVVHHLIATIAGAKTDLFAGLENQLLQAELPQQGFALVRDGFALTPPAKPIAQPAN